jgi:hypothetical protein
MPPKAQWWEKRAIARDYGAHRHGAEHRREVLRLIEWAIRRHREQDQREAKASCQRKRPS